MADDRPSSSNQLLPVDNPPPTTSGPPRPQPRLPSTLEGLLRFAMEATKTEDTTRSHIWTPLDEERKKFLENAINSLTIDVTKELQKAIAVLSDNEKISAFAIDADPSDDVIIAYECIVTQVSSIDNAIGFYKLGGFNIFPVCLSCENITVRGLASSILAELCQNNPFCQARVLECGYLPILMDILKNEQDITLLSRTLYGISCIIRNNEDCTKIFLNRDGFSGLKNALEKPKCNLKMKAAFLISCLISENKNVIDDIVSSGAFKALVYALPEIRDVAAEEVLAALHDIISSFNETMIKELNEMECHLKNTLTEYLKDDELHELTQCLKEKQYCEAILQFMKENKKQKTFYKQQSETDIDR